MGDNRWSVISAEGFHSASFVGTRIKLRGPLVSTDSVTEGNFSVPGVLIVDVAHPGADITEILTVVEQGRKPLSPAQIARRLVTAIENLPIAETSHD